MNFKSVLLQYILDSRWNIGFVYQDLDRIVFSDQKLSISWLKHNYRDRWFADPFILDVRDDVILVLVEECLYNNHKGRISLLTIDRHTCSLLNNETLLELPTHLSFPFIVRKEGEVLVCPESGESGKLVLYRLDLPNRRLVYHSTLLCDSVSDAVIAAIGCEDCIIATEWPNPSTDWMTIYRENNGAYEEWRTIKFDRKIARNAGTWFDLNGKYIRPVQDCDRRYGAALEFQEIDPENITFKSIRRIEVTSPKYNLGIHTFNFYKTLSVVDGYGYRRPLLAMLYAFISNTYHKLIGVDYRI